MKNICQVFDPANHSDKDWYGFDLDGTVAFYDGWISHTHIGEPIPAMVNLIKNYIAMGRRCVIFTARVGSENQTKNEEAEAAIKDWTLRHIGQALEVTNKKDPNMIELYDDRAVGIIQNTGLKK